MMSRRWRRRRINRATSLRGSAALRPAALACSDLEVPLGKSTALFACHPGSGKGADSRQATRRLVREGAWDRVEIGRGK